MSNSNLPPGCSSDDGGLDHARDAVIERIADEPLTAEQVAARWDSQPELLQLVKFLPCQCLNRKHDGPLCRRCKAIAQARPPDVEPERATLDRGPNEVRKWLDEMADNIERHLQENPSKFRGFSLHVGTPPKNYKPPIRLTDYATGQVIALPISLIHNVIPIEASQNVADVVYKRTRIDGPGICCWIVRESASEIKEIIGCY